MRHKYIIATLIAASLMHLGSVAADDGASGDVVADASVPVVSKTLSGGFKDRPDLIAIGPLYASVPALVKVQTDLLDLAPPIRSLPVYLTTLRLRL